MKRAFSIHEVQIDPRRLRFLLAVARTGGVLAAADELAVTPSAVSQQLARLESEVGRPLLVRTNSGTTLTPAGLALAESAEQIEQALGEARARIEQQDGEVTGVVRVGGFQSAIAGLIAPHLGEWRLRYPGLEFDIVEAEQAELIRGVRGGDHDVVILEFDAGETTTGPMRGVTEVPLLDEPWKLVVPAGTVLGSEPVDLSRLSVQWLGVEAWGASTRALRRIRHAFGEEQLRASRHRYTATETALALVAAGEGAALLPSLALHSLAGPGVEVADVAGLGTRRIVLQHLAAAGGASTPTGVAAQLIREAASAFDSGALGEAAT